jgi:two-component system nitrate/nitrite response regulator NarL
MQTETKSNALTKREHDVMQQLILGKTNKEIACQLGIVESVVETHLRNIYLKLSVRNRLEAANKYNGTDQI